AMKLPATLSFVDGALVEPLAVGSYGVRQSSMRAGDRVLVLGGGSVALCVIWQARRRGAGRIVALSRSARRRAMAEAMGADAFVVQGENDVQAVADALGGSPRIVFECVGEPGLIGMGLRHVGVFGEVVSLGFCTSPDSFVPAAAAMKGAVLKFPVGYTLDDFEMSARAMERGHADPKMLVTSVASLEETPATFERLRAANAETKVHVAPG
ncbi:MAG: zinc-binding dehydrogenase, partial [Parvularculaceae bacterium]|nr:zinc-binding dehydrogenase [Parvularculaceae bacterium]